MIAALLLLTAAQTGAAQGGPALPAPAARLIHRLTQLEQNLGQGDAPDWSQLWGQELDLPALNARVLVDRPELSARDQKRLQVALQFHLEARGRTQAAKQKSKLNCNFGGARWSAPDPHLVVDCQLGGRPLLLELWLGPSGRVADAAIDEVRLSRNLRAQLNRSLRTRGVDGTVELLTRPHLAASG